MPKSKEYPDLPWVEPRSWTNANRGLVQLVVVHTTEGSAHTGSAENGADYDARRTDGTSCHYFHDSNSTIQCVVTADVAHTAKGQGNRRGIHHELCTKAGKADWSDGYHTAMLQRAAKQAARDCRKWKIPARRLSVADVRNGVKGICGHHDVSLAFGQSTHTDPGVNFPWTRFIGMIKAELTPPTPPKEDDMDDATIAKIAKAVTAAVWGDDTDLVTPGTQSARGALLTENARSKENRTVTEPDQLRRLQELEEKANRLDGKLDEVLSILRPEPPADPA